MSPTSRVLLPLALAFSVTTHAHAEAPASVPPPPKKLTVGTEGLFQPGLLLQGWFLVQDQADTTSTFRLRRAELSVKGEILPQRVAYALMIDAAKVLEPDDTVLLVKNQDPAPTDPTKPEQVVVKQTSSALSMLQDFFITYQSEWVDVSVGQFKTPVSLEGYGSSSKLLFPERARVAREFGDKRDLGVRLAKSFEYIGYSAGIFNGAGPNRLDGDNDKDLALRLEAYPFKGLTIAGAVQATVGARDVAKDRFEGDVRLDLDGFLAQAEYIHASDKKAGAAAVSAQGFYLALAYTFADMWQPCVRIGYLDTDTDKNVAAGSKDELFHFEVGLNVYLHKHEAKLQLAFAHVAFEDAAALEELVLASQVAF